MTKVLALADQSKIGCITQRRFAKVGTKTHPQRGADLDRNGLSVSTETACRFEPKSPVGNSEICSPGSEIDRFLISHSATSPPSEDSFPPSNRAFSAAAQRRHHRAHEGITQRENQFEANDFVSRGQPGGCTCRELSATSLDVPAEPPRSWWRLRAASLAGGTES